jgi:hypothetical protein
MILPLRREGEIAIKARIYKHLNTAFRFRKEIAWVVKLLVLLLTFYYLYETVFLHTRQTEALWAELTNLSRSHRLKALLLPLLLLPLNWGLEAVKWQILARSVEKLTFLKAYQAVVAGVTLGMITPNRVGDYAARILMMSNKFRIKATGAVLLGRLCQMHSTVLFGSAGGMYFFVHYYANAYPLFSLAVGVSLLIANAGFTLFLYHTDVLVPFVAGFKPLQPLIPLLVVLKRFSTSMVHQLLLISALRYAVFTTQFVLLLKAMDIAGSQIGLLSGVTATFLVKSLLPSFNFLSDIGVRELSAMHFFSLLGQDEIRVLTASLCLWLINIAVPALVGLLFVFQFRLFRSR